MKSLLVSDAAEYNAATDRVNSALQLLRDEMKSLRHQDVTLTQQFLAMNSAIRSISRDQKSEKRRTRRSRKSSNGCDMTMSSCSSLLVRQQGANRYCGTIRESRERTWSDSSDESLPETPSGSMTSLNDDTDSTAYCVPVFSSSWQQTGIHEDSSDCDSVSEEV